MTQVISKERPAPPLGREVETGRRGPILLVVALVGALVGLGVYALTRPDPMTPTEIAQVRAEQFAGMQAGRYQAEAARVSGIAEVRARQLAEHQQAMWEASRRLTPVEVEAARAGLLAQNQAGLWVGSLTPGEIAQVRAQLFADHQKAIWEAAGS